MRAVNRVSFIIGSEFVLFNWEKTKSNPFMKLIRFTGRKILITTIIENMINKAYIDQIYFTIQKYCEIKFSVKRNQEFLE